MPEENLLEDSAGIQVDTQPEDELVELAETSETTERAPRAKKGPKPGAIAALLPKDSQTDPPPEPLPVPPKMLLISSSGASAASSDGGFGVFEDVVSTSKNGLGPGLQLALLEGRKLVEFAFEPEEGGFAVGDIFLARVKRTAPGMNAAFVEVGHAKDAFLHYTDLGPQIISTLRYVKESVSGRQSASLKDFVLEDVSPKNGKIEDTLRKSDLVLVSVDKEPINTKGPRVTAQLSLAGRYLVAHPFEEGVSVSKKIEDDSERRRLKNLISKLKPANFGFIVRTAAEGRTTAELAQDLAELEQRWQTIHKGLVNGHAPKLLLAEVGRATGMLRDLLNDTFASIWVDSQEVFDEVHAYLKRIDPEKVNLLKLHRQEKGDNAGGDKAKSLFERFDVERQSRIAFNKVVNMPGGAYLVIEATEALHVIDVNSGNRVGKEVDQEATALKTNMEAAEEIARQIRLRDLGGIIVIDFIDLKRAPNRRKLHQYMEALMERDRSRHTVLPLSKFGLMEITRQRARPGLPSIETEPCPACHGTGQSVSQAPAIPTEPKALLAEIEAAIKAAFEANQASPSSQIHAHPLIEIHPFLLAFLEQGLQNRWALWAFKRRHKASFLPTATLPLGTFQIRSLT